MLVWCGLLYVYIWYSGDFFYTEVGFFIYDGPVFGIHENVHGFPFFLLSETFGMAVRHYVQFLFQMG